MGQTALLGRKKCPFGEKLRNFRGSATVPDRLVQEESEQKRGQAEEREALRAFKESSITWCLKQLVVSVLGTGHTSTSCQISLETQ